MIAFFCSTPYQIIIACQLKTTVFVQENVDIYILNHFYDADLIYTNLSKEKLFHRIHLADCYKFTKSFSNNTIFRLFQKSLHYLNFRKLSKSFFDISTEKYDHVFLSYPDVVIQLAIKKIHENNSKVKIHMFEDGSGGYSNVIRNTTFIKKLFKVVSSSLILDVYEDLWLFKPELIIKSDIELKTIPIINKADEKIKFIINRIFNYTPCLLDEKVVFFEQPYDNIFNKAMFKLALIFKKYDHIVKIHPRSKTEDYRNFKFFEQSYIPWEVISLNNNISQKILISHYSTAAISNKIMFNEEPTIFFLFDIPELKSIYKIEDDDLKFILNFKSTYSKPNSILIPKSVEEFESDLTKLLN